MSLTRRRIEIKLEDIPAPAPRHRLEIQTSELQDPIHVQRPLDQETLHRPYLDVRGTTPLRSEICLAGPGGLHTVAVPLDDGTFRFVDVALQPQYNEFTIGKHGANCVIATGRRRVRVLFTDPYLGYQDKDMYVKRRFQRGDDVARCLGCKVYFFRTTFETRSACPNCDSRSWVCHPDPAYYAPKLKK